MKQVSALGLLALAQWVTAQEECLSLTTNFPPCAVSVASFELRGPALIFYSSLALSLPDQT